MTYAVRGVVLLVTMSTTLCTVLCGCSLFVSATQGEIKAQDTAAADYKFLAHKSTAILACVRSTGGQCKAATDMRVEDVAATVPPGRKAAVVASLTSPLRTPNPAADAPSGAGAALAAADVITNPTAQKLETLFHRASGQDSSMEPIQFSRDELRAYGKSIQDATALNGWSSLRAYLTTAKRDALDASGKAAVDSTIRQVNLIESYLSAYFSNGRFLRISIDASQAQQSFVSELQKYGVSADAAQALFSGMAREIAGTKPDANGKITLVAPTTDGGFVTRGGTKYVFTGVSLTLNPTSNNLVQASKIDFTQVGADVVRIVLEATGDEVAQLPADRTSTACLLKKNGQLDNYPGIRCYADGGQDEQVSAEQFARVTTAANQLESVAATATGQVIRGISWISLNNEALAKLIETAVGVVSRKATEKVAWCYYACSASNTADAPSWQPVVQTVPLRFSK